MNILNDSDTPKTWLVDYGYRGETGQYEFHGILVIALSIRDLLDVIEDYFETIGVPNAAITKIEVEPPTLISDDALEVINAANEQ